MTGIKTIADAEECLDEPTSTIDLLKHAPLDRLEKMVATLKLYRPAAEIRQAMVERIARVPLADFETIKHIYLKHCGDPRS